MDIWENEISRRMDSIKVSGSMLSTSFDSTDYEQYFAEKSINLSEIDSFLQLLNDLSDEVRISKCAMVDSAKVLNLAISPTNQMESNEQFINQLYLDKFLWNNGELTSNEWLLVDSIAYQCPTLGGKAVAGARSILAQTGLVYFFDNDSLCQVMESRPSSLEKQRESRAFAVKIYPNPAKDFVFVDLPELRDESRWDLIIYNLAGNSISQKYNFENGSSSSVKKISIQDLPAGVYILQITTSDKVYSSNKIVIFR